MTVTRVTIDSYSPKASGICAEASVVFDNEFAIHKVSVIAGDLGLFVSMPNTGKTRIYNSKKRFEDLCHPLSKTLSDSITEAVLKAYNEYKA